MENLKRKIAIMFLTFIATILLTIVSGQKVMAEHPSTISAVQEGKKVGGSIWFHVKTSGGKKVFCTSGLNVATPAGTGRTCSLINSGQWSESNQAAIAAIISEYDNGRINGYYDPYWYTELAINKYLGKSVYSAGSDSLVQSLVAKAKNAAKKAGTKFEATLSSSSIVFKKEGNYYVSNVITVSDKGGFLDEYDVKVTGTNKAEIYNKKGNSFQVRFPASNVEIGKKVTITVGVSAKKSYGIAKNYYCGSGVQNVTLDYIETKHLLTYLEIKGSVERKGNAVEIVKYNPYTGKNIAGAILVLKNSSGKQIASWKTSTTTKKFTNLPAGTYTITEAEAPKGYKRSTEIKKITIKEDGQTTKVKFANYPETGVNVLKVDAITNQPVADATLVIKNAQGKVVKTLTTGTKAIKVDLEAGNYTLEETKAPKGYKRSTEIVKFTVDKKGGYAEIKYKNYPETGVNVLKVDAITNQPVADATLVIKNAQGKVVKTLTTGTKAIKVDLEAGNYTLEETKAPKGYKRSTEIVKFTVDKKGGYAEIKYKNYPETGVNVLKVDAITNQPVADATLVIKNAQGKVVKTLTTGTKAIKVDLEAGNYTLEETKAPKGYKRSTEIVKFTVDKKGGYAEIKYKNYPETGVNVLKVDAITNQPVADATLVIKNAQGKVVKTLTTGTKAIKVDLEAGNYTLEETKAPKGYKRSTEIVKFTVDKKGGYAEIKYKNYPETGVEISKIDITTGKELPGATLVIKDANGKEVKSWVSTTEPTYFELEPGKYTLSETIAPEGYKLSKETIEFEVKEDGTTTKVTMENKPKTGAKISKQDITNKQELPGATLVIKDANGKEVKSWVSTTEPTYFELEPGKYTLSETIAPEGYKLSTETIEFEVKEDGTTTEVVMYNEPMGTVVISKQDITNKQELPGATLVIKDANGKEMLKWVSLTTPKTFKLEPGKYTLSETISPKGYKLSTETIEFEVKNDGTTTEVVMYNEPFITGAKISKQDITNKQELPGATLIIKDANGKEVKSWVSTTEPTYFELEPGKYTLSETIAPEGYKLSTETIEFEVKEDGTTAEVVMYNEPFITGAKISKQDITNKQELPGATLVIKDANGNEVKSWVSTDKPHYFELQPGKYTLSETISPVGYKLSTETIEFEVKEDGTTTEVVMYNEPSRVGVKISKQDITTKQELPGATLVIKDANGNEVASWVSTSEPRYIELEPGDYTLTEITAPNGYDLSYEVVRFTVNEDGTTDGDVIMYNSKTPVTSDKNLLFTVIGFLSAGIVGTVAIKKLKHQM